MRLLSKLIIFLVLRNERNVAHFIDNELQFLFRDIVKVMIKLNLA